MAFSVFTSVVPIIIGIVILVLLVKGIVILCLWRKSRTNRKLVPADGSSSQTPLSQIIIHPYEAVGAVHHIRSLLGSDSDRPSERSSQLNGASSGSFGPQCFTYEQLRIATDNFSDSQLLGKGGSGSVYRGELPGDGTIVAVKCIPGNSERAVKEFNAEVSIISDLRHRNLVKLKGWCHDQGKFLVVYDYMPNGSLDSLLFNDARCVSSMNWARRFAIATGLGSALMYLHDECDRVIIHRDVKSSNVLLDEGFVAKLGDFGLSRQVAPGVTSHMTSVYAGTWGYMAPELIMSFGKATRETDVYAYGVVLLELVSGKRVLDASLQEYDELLLSWVWHLFGQGNVLQAVDKRLGAEWDSAEAKRMLVVGLSCLHPDAQSRPKIRRALEMLNGTVALPYVPLIKPPSFASSLPNMSISQIMAQTSSIATTT